MYNWKRKALTAGMLCLALHLAAQGPNNSGTYYQNADGKKGSALKTALSGVIHPHTVISYNGLWEAFKTTDNKGDNIVWDMYSNTTSYDIGGSEQGANYKGEGDSYNREHSFPKSWFGDASPMYSDLVHIVPTDGYVNNRRSNYPFGETNGEDYKSNNGFSKLGASTTSGYSGTVFEPNDEYKGDFARIYFYMATCYEDNFSSWSSPMLAGNKYPAYKDWALTMLLKWAKEDPVSDKEIARNNAAYALQKNRNPFVDYPGLEQYVWGTMTDVPFSYDNYNGDIQYPDPGTDPVVGEQTYAKVTAASQLQTGYGYIIVYEGGSVAMSDMGSSIRNGAAVTISSDKIVTTVNESGKPYQMELGGKSGEYTLYSSADNVYLALNSSDNKLHGAETADTDNAKWTINVSATDATISNNAYPERSINYNTGSPRFACYKATSKQQPVALYKNVTPSSIMGTSISNIDNAPVDVYSLTGMAVKCQVERTKALKGLNKGVYIINNRKYIVR